MAAPPSIDEVTGYAREVVGGSVLACQLVKKACTRHLSDLESGPARGLRWDRESAQRAIGFFRFLRHSKGEWAGKELLLASWQKFVVGSLFGWKRADELRRFRTAYIEVPRKNGKSTIAAGIGLYGLIADNEPGAEIYSVATKRDQAKIVFEEAKAMVNHSPALGRRIKVQMNNLHCLDTRSKFEPLSSDARTLDGLNVYYGLVDELHAHRTREVWDVLQTATGARRQPLLFVITTAGTQVLGVCYEQRDYSVKLLNEVVADDSYFSVIYTIDEGDDWTLEQTWRKANPNYGISVKPEDLADLCQKAQEVPGEQNGFLTKRLNIWCQQEELWLDIDVWKQAPAPLPIEQLKGRDCWLGLDLSTTTDLTALVAVFPPLHEDENWEVLSYFFLPEENIDARVRRDNVPYDRWARDGFLKLTDGNVVDYGAVRNQIANLSEFVVVREIGFDPWNATHLSTDLAAEGFTMVEIRQGFRTMSEPSKKLERLVMSRKLAHRNNPVLTYCISNVTLRHDDNDNYMPSKGKSTRRIDGAVALIIALARPIQESGGTIDDFLASPLVL